MVKVVLCLPNIINYPRGGGHWAWAVQYALALQKAGCKVLCIFVEKGDGMNDKSDILLQQKRFESYCPGVICATIALFLERTTLSNRYSFIGITQRELETWGKEADVLWNLSGSFPKAFLPLFRKKALIDVDPGYFQVAAESWGIDFSDYDSFFTVGMNVGNTDCEVPLCGKTWKTFPQILYLDFWKEEADPGPTASFTSITHWWGDEIEYNGRKLSCEKRKGYLELLELPALTGLKMTLGTNDDPSEATAKDKLMFRSRGWNFVSSTDIAKDLFAYREFIATSRGEICAPKPIYSALNTGWISDRSVGYLATGRPVLMRETGISAHLPTGTGLVTYHSLEEAAESAKEIWANYSQHARQARKLAEEILDSRTVLPGMLEASINA